MAFRFDGRIVHVSLLFVVFGWSLVFGGHSVPLIRNVDFSKTTNSTFVKLSLALGGDNLDADLRLRLTVQPEDGRTAECFDEQILLPELAVEFANRTSAVAGVVLNVSEFESWPSGLLGLCVLTADASAKNDHKWLNVGRSVVFRTKAANPALQIAASPAEALPQAELKPIVRQRREITATIYKGQVRLDGLRLESAESSTSNDDGDSAEPTLLADSKATFRLYGFGWTSETLFVWTMEAKPIGQHCEYIVGVKTKLDGTVYENTTSVLIDVLLPPLPKGQSSATLYFCTHEPKEDKYYRVGEAEHCRIKIKERFIPLWAQFVIIVVCLSFSSLFSGLNLGLLSLNRTDLKIISNTGTDSERRYAQAIYPVRIHGNYLLCSILLGNVLVNSIFTILLDDMSSGIVAVVVSTLCIVIIGEICPQAVCSRHGLAIGAKTIYITKTVMVLTAPLAWPLSRLLDLILGEEIATTYTRERLKELVKITTEFNDLEKDEVNIISGALELRKKTVGEVMTKIEDVYMLSYDTILDFETVSEIMKSGFSRIPVYEGTRRNIVSLLYIKDLALIDPDDNTPLKTLSQFYQNSCYYVFEDTTLDVVFKQFKEGCKGHMAFVHQVNNEGDGDPFYETVGIVTLEDVIEELIQAEIMDETDVYTDNRTKQRRSERMMRNQNFSLFAERSENQRVHISPQLNMAAFQFLSSSVDAFKPDNISETVLLRLLKHDIMFHIKMKDKEKLKDDPSFIIYQQGKPADYFTLILEGRVEVTVGRESLVFESGPFTHFGSQALMSNVGVAESPTNVAQPMGSLQSVNLESMLRYSFIPDYTVRAVTEVFYLRIKRSHYLAAKKATLLERSKKVSNAGEHFDDEVEKLLHNYEKGVSDEDTRSQISREGSFSNPQNIQYIEDSPRISPVNVNQENSNNGFISSAVSPSRTPRTSDRIEEKATLLGVSPSNHDDRSSNS